MVPPLKNHASLNDPTSKHVLLLMMTVAMKVETAATALTHEI
jgi:hypothetical protein